MPLLLVTSLLVTASPVAALSPPAGSPLRPQPGLPRASLVGSTDPADPKLQSDLDAVVALSPPRTCLSVSIKGQSVYRHGSATPIAPASTEKLFTAAVALDQLGPETRFVTRVVAGTAPVDGVVVGDLTLVGGGDPLLVTDLYRVARRFGPDEPFTSLDQLAERLAASGVRRVTGRIVGDETRYDRVRSVPSWPARYVRQDQAGPLSALTVDDGYELLLPEPGDDGPIEQTRAADPAATAARLLTDRLLIRGIRVDGAVLAGSGPAPAAAMTLAEAASAPLSEIVRYMLLASDNQVAELLTKEVGRAAGQGGSTAAGIGVINRRARSLGVDREGSTAVDGSGLDPANRVTCDGLVSLLDTSGGLGAQLGRSLPVAGRSGTLLERFRGTPAEGTLHAKTGSLVSVRALAGFVELPEGGTATFAYVVNAERLPAQLDRVQDFLATVLGGYLPPCPEPGPAGLVAPLAPYAGQVGALAMFPLQSVLLPGAVLPLHVFEDRYKALVDRCMALQEDFGVVLISRGSEVGGQDVRTDAGTVARILEAQQAHDGRWAVLALGVRRIRIDRWLPDDPYPVAEVADWPDPPAPAGFVESFETVTGQLRRVLALRAELGETGPPATVDLSTEAALDDASLASFGLVALSPVGDLDRQRLLTVPDIGERLSRLDQLLQEEEEVCRARLTGA